MANSTVCQSKRKPIVEPRRAKSKTYRQAPTHWLKFYEEAVIESEARTAVSLDFSTLYTAIPHDKFKSKLKEIINQSFFHKNGNRRSQYVVIG